MHRRGLFKSLLGCLLIPTGVKAEVPTRHLLLQQSPLAGFHYYDAMRVWPALAVATAVSRIILFLNKGARRQWREFLSCIKRGYPMADFVHSEQMRVLLVNCSERRPWIDGLAGGLRRTGRSNARRSPDLPRALGPSTLRLCSRHGGAAVPRRITLDIDPKLGASLRHLPGAQIGQSIGPAVIAVLDSRPPQPAPRNLPSKNDECPRTKHAFLHKPCCRDCANSHRGEEPLCFNVFTS